jgi:elongation factor G
MKYWLHCVRQCLANKIVPMLCGSSFKNKGVQTMLDLVMELLPSPMDKERNCWYNPETGEEVSRKPDVKEPFTALAFKIATDPFVGRLAFFRAYSGRLEAGSYITIHVAGTKSVFHVSSKCMLTSKTQFRLSKLVI